MAPEAYQQAHQRAVAKTAAGRKADAIAEADISADTERRLEQIMVNAGVSLTILALIGLALSALAPEKTKPFLVLVLCAGPDLLAFAAILTVVNPKPMLSDIRRMQRMLER